MGNFQWVEIPHAGIRYIRRKSDGQSLPADTENSIINSGETIDAAALVTNAEGIRRAAAQQALQMVNWQQELSDINAGKALLAQMAEAVPALRTKVSAIKNDGAIPLATRERIADVLNSMITIQVNLGTIQSETIDKIHMQGSWWYKLMQLQSLADGE